MKPEPRHPLHLLTRNKVIASETFSRASALAERHGLRLDDLLLREYGLPRVALQQDLAEYYQCPVIEYDERLPVPPELLIRVERDRLRKEGWFPVIARNDGTVVVACIDPADPSLPGKIRECLGQVACELRVCLPDDIRWFTEDFLHARPGKLIGTERTGLAYWRNNMAQWRTVLACYRTDMGRARTALAVIRSGLALVTISFALSRAHQLALPHWVSLLILILGCLLAVAGVSPYLEVRRTRLKPPGNMTLMEVTAAELTFLEKFLNLETAVSNPPTRDRMLGRLGDLLLEYCTILYPPPGSLERTHLARERNVLAAQRTIAGCNRTIYARARTGLAFIRTGIAFISIGIGLIEFFGLGLNTFFDAMLIVLGLLLTVDGVRWFLPAYREQADFAELGSRFRLDEEGARG